MSSIHLDPITLEILWRRLNATVDELAATLVRTSFSTVIRDVNDYACAIFDLEARLLAQSLDSTPGLCGPLGHMLKHLLDWHPVDTLLDGDVLIGNDPWQGSGHHNDITIATPAFHNGKLIGFAVTCAHHADIGGRRATTESRDNYEEGLRIPPSRLYEAGKSNDTVFNFIRHNVRMAETVVGDLRAQLAANHIGCERLRQICIENDWADIQPLADQVVERSEAVTRAEIRKIPEGIYRHEAAVDVIDGKDVVIKVAVHVKDGSIVIDYSGTSAQVRPAVNCTLTFTASYTNFALMCLLALPVPVNAGTLRPITLKADPGSVLNANFPAPVFARTSTGNYLPEIIYAALAKAVPDRVLAGGSAPLWAQYMYGRFKDGREFATLNCANGGVGARQGHDGISTLAFPFNIANTPVEVLESEVPVLCTEKKLWVDSAGPGEFRGGLGQVFALKILEGDIGPDGDVLIGFRGGRFVHKVPGLLQGRPAPNGELLINGESTTEGKQVALPPGGTILLRIPGGGGMGDPMRRDRNLVKRDLQDGLITASHAKQYYGYEDKPVKDPVSEPAA